MTTTARTPKYMYKTAPGNSGDLSIEYGTDLGALTRLEVSLDFKLRRMPPSNLQRMHSLTAKTDEPTHTGQNPLAARGFGR